MHFCSSVADTKKSERRQTAFPSGLNYLEQPLTDLTVQPGFVPPNPMLTSCLPRYIDVDLIETF